MVVDEEARNLVMLLLNKDRYSIFRHIIDEEGGLSAEAISRQTDIDLDTVRYHLLRMSEIGALTGDLALIHNSPGQIMRLYQATDSAKTIHAEFEERITALQC